MSPDSHAWRLPWLTVRPLLRDGPDHFGMDRRISIADVARAAGVARSTVSKAFAAETGRYNLSEEIRDRILAAAMELGYEPDWRRHILARARSRFIGLAGGYSIPDTTGVYEQVPAVLSETLFQSGWDLVLLPVDRGPGRHLGLDGLVLVDPLPPDLPQLLRRMAIPAVAINVVPPNGSAAVLPDDAGGARMAVEHLAGLGHRRIAYMTRRHNRTNPTSTDARLGGYQATMSAAGLTPHVMVGPSHEVILQLQGADAPTALVVYDHRDLLELMPHLRARHIDMPRDLSVVCLDDISWWEHHPPPITAIDVGMDRVAARAGAILVDHLNGVCSVGTTVHLCPVRLVVRATTAPPSRR